MYLDVLNVSLEIMRVCLFCKQDQDAKNAQTA